MPHENVTDTIVSALKSTIHVFPIAEVQPLIQFVVVEVPVGVAVKVTVLGIVKFAIHALGQLMPTGALTTVPVPVPRILTPRAALDPPEVPVKQTTLAFISAVIIAPVEGRLPALWLVETVAEMRVPPQARPVAVINPEELTMTIWVSFEAQVTLSVMSLVTGG